MDFFTFPTNVLNKIISKGEDYFLKILPATC